MRRELGAGQFGMVYLAHDSKLDRLVALKVPHAQSFTSPRAVERFEREARAAAALRHPHIVPIYAAGFDGTYYFIASQFISSKADKASRQPASRTLAGLIDEGPVEFRRTARIVRDLAEALAYAHEQGIVHRDVKPANVLLDAQGSAHLADFGLAHRQDSQDKLTQEGAVLGTPAYMSPEQASGRKEEVLPASDQYSLGMVLYEMLCGEVAFRGPVGFVSSQQIHQEPEAPHKRRAGVPRDLETICLKALAKDPQQRYENCQAMADDLRRWLDDEPIQARRMGPMERAVRWVRRNPVVAGLTGAVAASLLLGTVVATLFAAQAREATKAATKQKDAAEREAYVGHVTLAQREWQDGDAAAAWEHLNACRQDLRGWECRYLRTLFTKSQQTLRGHTDGVTSVSFSPDGKRIASGSWDKTVKVWDAERGEVVLTLKGQSAPIASVSFSPDGKRIASASGDKTVKVWDAEKGNELWTIKGNTSGAVWLGSSVSFSLDGKRIASADGTVRVWDAETGNEGSAPSSDLETRCRV